MTVALWGPPGCGKTTLALRMAAGLSRTSTVAVLFCDTLLPPLPVILPSAGKSILSVGGALSSVEISAESILRYANVLPSNGNVVLFGFGPGENCRSYPVFSEGRAASFLAALGGLCEYLIIDCQAAASEDPLCLAAMRTADRVVRVYSPDMSSIVFYESNLRLLSEAGFDTGRHLRILNNPDAEIARPVGETLEGMKRCDYVFPHIRALKQGCAEGRALDIPPSRRLNHSTEMLCGFCRKGEKDNDE